MIKYEKRIKQVLDFKGIGNTKIHPSDIDGVLEFNNQYLIILEVKLEGMKIPVGQRLLLHRIADAWQKVNKEAFVIYCYHETTTEEVINLENTRVIGLYHAGKKYKRNENIRNFLVKLAEHYNIEKLKNAL